MKLIVIFLVTFYISTIYAECGHYDGYPMDVCNFRDTALDEAIMYTCEPSPCYNSQWTGMDGPCFYEEHFDNANCDGNATTFIDFSELCNDGYWPGRCVCDLNTECEIGSSTESDCENSDYIEISFILNQCIPESNENSKIAECTGDRDQPVIEYEYHDSTCECNNDQLTGNTQCTTLNTGTNENCAYAGPYVIGQCAYQDNANDQSEMYICSWNNVTMEYDYSVRFWYLTSDCTGASFDYSLSICSSHPDRCHCGNDDGTVLATSDDCSTVAGYTENTCSDTVNEIFVIDQCYWESDGNGYDEFITLSCDNGIVTETVYYDNTCTKIEPDPPVHFNPECEQDWFTADYDCTFNVPSDDTQCGHWDESPVNTCYFRWDTLSGTQQSSYITCSPDTGSGETFTFYAYYASANCSGTPDSTIDITSSCQQNGGDSSCFCGDPLMCNLLQFVNCEPSYHQEEDIVLNKCVWNEGDQAYRRYICVDNNGKDELDYESYSDKDCTLSPTPPPVDSVAICIDYQSEFCTASPTEQPTPMTDSPTSDTDTPTNTPSDVPTNTIMIETTTIFGDTDVSVDVSDTGDGTTDNASLLNIIINIIIVSLVCIIFV